MKTRMVGLLLLFGALGAIASAAGVIDEGFFVDGLEGTLKREPGVDVWSFVCDSDITMSKKKTIFAGVAIQFLPCSVLEQMTKLAGEEQTMRVKLWALFTKYKQNNYLYAIYFVPLIENEPVEEVPQNDDPADQNGEEESIIPQNILSQIRQKETPDMERVQQIAAVTGDVNLIGRTGFLELNGKVHTFRMDAFGMNKGRGSLMLLPNQMLEDVHREIARNPGRQRYTVSGLITTYKGKQYMLVRRAVRTYTQGNFTR